MNCKNVALILHLEKMVIKFQVFFYFPTFFVKLQTLLARATYDNHADAPDELSIRKGDIVTVIEKDIDGLVGWWLCLLHGQQGIVPGNRLQVIDPTQLVKMERRTSASKKRGSYETDDNSDGHDVPDGLPTSSIPPSSNYDYLPNPVKTPGVIPQLSIKDMFDIPIKKQGGGGPGDVYDVPSSLNSTFDTSQQEIYDIPSNRSSSKRNSVNLNHSGYESPRTGRKEYDGPTETYDVPANLNRNSASNYDSPRTGRKEYDGPTETYDVPANLIQSSASNYNSPRVGLTETYDVPANLIKKRATPKLPAPYQVPKGTVSVDELYDVPKANSRAASMDVDELMGEIFDSPFNNDDPDTNTIKRRTPSNSNHSTPRGSFISNHSESQETYDVPRENTQHPRNNARKNLHLQSPATNSFSHTLPRGFSPRSKKNNIGAKTPTRLQDIYNLPSHQSPLATSNNSLPGSPPSTRKVASGDGQEIYDVPASNMMNSNEPTSNPEFMSMLRQLELGGTGGDASSNRSSFDSSHHLHPQDIYDVPSRPSSNRSSIGSGMAMNQYQNTQQHHLSQEIYDVPPTNNNNNISHDSSELYDVPQTARNSSMKRYSSGRILGDFQPPTETSTPRDPPQEIYDTPPASMRRASNERMGSHQQHQQEIYDVPPSQQQQDIYDVPATHDVDRVMEEAGAYNSHKRRNNNKLVVPGGREGGEDDYVDYQDIWNKEPPKELVRQHAKVNSLIV